MGCKRPLPTWLICLLSSALLNPLVFSESFADCYILLRPALFRVPSSLKLFSRSTTFPDRVIPATVIDTMSEVKMKIESLLNPVAHRQDLVQEEEPSEWASTVTRVVDGFRNTTSQVQSPRSTPTPPKPESQRLAKDAPIFRKGQPKGDVQFPPHEAEDNEDLAAQHKKFQVFPIGAIASYVHRIPYSSDKKTFMEKTGRDAFEGMPTLSCHSCTTPDISFSLPIHLQASWRGQRVHRHVGLQYRAGEDHSFLQMLQILQG